jgi:hypothetical protein
MADAYSLEAKWDGVDPASRKPYDYREVDLDRTFTVGDGDTHGDPNIEAEPPTPSAFDHITKLARVLAKRYEHKGQKLDVAEMLAVILDKIDP